MPSSGCEKSLPKLDELTFAGVSTVSESFAPVRRLSLWYVNVPA